MTPSLTQAELCELLASGSRAVLPSEEAARHLRSVYAEAQQHVGLKAWQPPDVFSWNQWVHSLWTECVLSGVEERLLLNAAQEHSLWREVVARHQDALTSIDTLVDLAVGAWRLAGAYRATDRLTASAATHDARTFASWAEQFQHICRQDGHLSSALLEAALARHVEKRSVSLQPSLIFAGFLSFVPAQQQLLGALAQAGNTYQTVDITTPAQENANRIVLCAEDEGEEIRAAAVWIRSFLSANLAPGPLTRVGVLVPTLGEDLDSIDSVFREILAPELERVDADLSSKPYRIGGQPLLTHPMIAVALDLARWAERPLDLPAVSNLLLSPYLRDTGEDLPLAAQFDAQVLRRAGLLRPEIGVASLLRLAQRSPLGAGAVKWVGSFHSFLAASASLKSPRSFANWSEFIRQLVRSAGWPGTRHGSSIEFEAAQAWDTALDAVATLDFSGRRVAYAEALQALERQLQRTEISSANRDPIVDVLPPQALPGLAFEALLVLRCTDSNWPPRETPNPLIDWKLQASLGMPGISSEGAAARAERNQQVLLQSAPSIVFSYAKANADGHLRLSPPVAQLQWPHRAAADLLGCHSVREALEPDSVPDDLPLPPLPSTHVRGGANLLKLQAACGFRAFAEIRLRSGEVDSIDLGLDAIEQGNVLHRVMSAFWQTVKSQENLQQMPSEERSRVLAECINDAFGKAPATGNRWEESYLVLQKHRLQRLLEQWLEHELRRGPFKVVAAESKQTVTLGPLDLDVRVDRIDAVENGVVLVDYKTGWAGKPNDWLGERPDEPQLPLYALLPEQGTLAGLAFAKVRAGEGMAWTGYSNDASVFPVLRNAVREVDSLVEEWRAHLTSLAEDFAAGDARVRPKEYPITCQHCGQRMLCRLDSATLLALSDTDETGTEEGIDG